MTNEAKASPEANPPVPPVAPPQPTFTAEQFNYIKTALKNKVEKNYSEFLTSIMQLPAEQPALNNAIMFFDTGYIWLKTAIDNIQQNQIQTVVPQPVQEPAQNPEAQPQAQVEEPKEGLAVGEYNPANAEHLPPPAPDAS